MGQIGDSSYTVNYYLIQVITIYNMSANTSAWLVPLLLVVACMALVINIFHNKKVNSSLVSDMETAQADLRVAADNSQDCSNKLEAKNAEVVAKDQQVATLTASVNTLTEEKAKIQEELTQEKGKQEQADPTTVAVEAAAPATLAIRLAANIVAGHLLLTLLGSQGPLVSFTVLIALFIRLVLLLLLGVAVACIQSYVFTILSSLYLNELISAEFRKKII